MRKAPGAKCSPVRQPMVRPSDPLWSASPRQAGMEWNVQEGWRTPKIYYSYDVLFPFVTRSENCLWRHIAHKQIQYNVTKYKINTCCQSGALFAPHCFRNFVRPWWLEPALSSSIVLYLATSWWNTMSCHVHHLGWDHPNQPQHHNWQFAASFTEYHHPNALRDNDSK